MKTMKITISNPSNYTKQTVVTNPETGMETIKETFMISYRVSGDAESVKAYREQQLKDAPNSKTAEDGTPLFQLQSASAVKYGKTAELTGSFTKEGKLIWYLDNEDKIFAELVKGADTVVQKEYATDKLSQLRAFAQECKKNRDANIQALKAKAATQSSEGEVESDF